MNHMEDPQEIMKKLEAAGQMRLPLEGEGSSSIGLACLNHPMVEVLHQHASCEAAEYVTSMELTDKSAQEGREEPSQGSLLADLLG